MPRISTDNYDTVASWNGSQDLFVVEQPDGTKVATPAMVKQYVLNNMDEVPTQDSNNPVKSGGIFSAVDDVYSVMGEMGAKNLIPYPYYHTSKTTAGITITDNGDGTLTFNGTSTSATVIFRMISNDANIEIPLNKSKYILTWVDSSEHKRYFRIDIALAKSDGTTIVVNGESGVINIDNTDGQYTGIYSMGIFTANNQTVSNLTFKPMLRIASDTDNTYQSYVKTNRQLTEEIGDLSQTGLTGDSVSEQLASLSGAIDSQTEGKVSRYAVSVENNKSVQITFASDYSTDAEFALVAFNIGGNALAGFALFALGMGNSKIKDLIGVMGSQQYEATFSTSPNRWTIKNKCGSTVKVTVMISKGSVEVI